jgi:hypothetical protein
MADFIEYIVEDEGDILRRFDRTVNLQRLRMREFLDELADTGVQLLNITAPDFSSYTRRHIDREPVRYTLAPTGGVWETTVGIKRGTSIHPLYAEFGTGIYATPPRGYITPRRAEYLSFYSFLYNRRIRVKQVKGQRPQRYFYRAWVDLNYYARLRASAIKLI